MVRIRIGVVAVLMLTSGRLASAQDPAARKAESIDLRIVLSSHAPSAVALARVLMSEGQAGQGIETVRPERRAAVADTTIPRNRRLGGFLGGVGGLIGGGIFGYQKGDPRVAFDQATGAAVYGLAGAAVGAIIGVIFAPRIP